MVCRKLLISSLKTRSSCWLAFAEVCMMILRIIVANEQTRCSPESSEALAGLKDKMGCCRVRLRDIIRITRRQPAIGGHWLHDISHCLAGRQSNVRLRLSCVWIRCSSVSIRTRRQEDLIYFGEGWSFSSLVVGTHPLCSGANRQTQEEEKMVALLSRLYSFSRYTILALKGYLDSLAFLRYRSNKIK